MANSSSRLAFDDCFKLFDRANAARKGIMVRRNSRGDAINLRTRLHTARDIDRRDNAAVYDQDHPLYWRSIYDDIICKIVQNETGTWLVLEKLSGRVFEIYEIEDEEDALLIEHEDVQLLENKTEESP